MNWFYENCEILNQFHITVGTTKADLQPYFRTWRYQDRDFSIDITFRAFLDRNSLVDDLTYLRIAGTTYKVIQLHKWEDYFEAWLYECEVE